MDDFRVGMAKVMLWTSGIVFQCCWPTSRFLCGDDEKPPEREEAYLSTKQPEIGTRYLKPLTKGKLTSIGFWVSVKKNVVGSLASFKEIAYLRCQVCRHFDTPQSTPEAPTWTQAGARNPKRNYLFYAPLSDYFACGLCLQLDCITLEPVVIFAHVRWGFLRISHLEGNIITYLPIKP